MKNKKPYWGSIAFAIIILYIWLTSCNPLGYDIWHTDENGNPVITDTIPTDTIYQEPIIDTCTDYSELTNLKWCSFALSLDGLPLVYQFYQQTGGQLKPINLDSFLLPYQAVHYYSGINLCIIVNGLDAPSWGMNHALYIKDLFGQTYLLIFSKYLFEFYGSLTFDQFYNELINHSNFTRLGFWNTAFECDQYNTIIDYIIDNCIEGNGNIIDLRHLQTPCTIDQERIIRLIQAHFQILQ